MAASTFDWSGAYFGGHFSYSLGHTTNTLFDSDATLSGKSLSSFYGGLQLGYNYVVRSGLTLGIEGDISFPYFLDNGLISSRTTPLGTTVTEQVDYVAALRARFKRYLSEVGPIDFHNRTAARFDEVHSFTHAFKQWASTAPKQARRAED